MAWHKAPDNRWNVYVYRPSVGRKVYVGRRALEREARALFREKTDLFAGEVGKRTEQTVTVGEYAAEWLEHHHGPGTKRPGVETYKINRGNIARLVEEFGEREMDGGISRREALSWSRRHLRHAKSVSAMFNDAVDEEIAKANPFANRKQEQPRERKDIHPLTEAEVERLAEIALNQWGADGYGLTARAWVLFAAWVGCRPGETFSVSLRDMNFSDGSVTIRRVKKRGKVYPTDKVAFPQAARDAITAMPVIPREGPVFRTVTDLRMHKSTFGSYWHPIRDIFRATISADRWDELTEGTKSLDFYALRHHVASIMADRGADARDIAAQLGNSVQVCEATYIHGFRDRQLERNRKVLERPAVVDLAAARLDRISG